MTLNNQGVVATSLFVCLLVSGCATSEKVAWMALGGRPPLSIDETQKHFASFSPRGSNSASLKTDFTIRESSAPIGVDIVVCQPEDNKAHGIELVWYDYGFSLHYLAGRLGDRLSQAETSRCKTAKGLKACGRMRHDRDFSICFNSKWKEDLATKGEAIEASPSRIDLRWRCSKMGFCSWSKDGVPLANAKFNLKLIPHRNEQVFQGFQEKERWRTSGLSPSEIQRWQNAGFELDEALAWGKNVPPEHAAKWKEKGWTLSDGRAWLKATRNLYTAIPWKERGFSISGYKAWGGFRIDADTAARWRKAKYAPKAANKWIRSGVGKPADAASLGRLCPKGIDPIEALYRSNPYDVKGRCFNFTGSTLQIFSKTTGLFLLGRQPMFLSFGKRSAPPHMFRGITKGVGVYKYKAASRSAKTVPSMKVVLFQEGN